MLAIPIQTSQVVELADISGEKLRYWKKCLPPIARRDGRKRGYNFAEVVALAAISEAMTQFQLDISRFEGVAEDFFEAVERIVRDDAGSGYLYLSDDQVSIGEPVADAAEVSLIFRIGRIAERLRNRMTAPEPAAQLNLV